MLNIPLHLSEELEQFESECEDLFSHFQHRNLEALVCAVRSTLDLLRKRLATSSSLRSQYDDGSRPVACFAADLVLSLPNIVSNHYNCSTSMIMYLCGVQVLVPSLEELQAVVNQVVQCVSDIGQSISCWTPPTQHSTSKQCLYPSFYSTTYYCICVANPAQVSNYHRAIHDSKDLLKLSSLLSSALLACRQDLMKVYTYI